MDYLENFPTKNMELVFVPIELHTARFSVGQIL